MIDPVEWGRIINMHLKQAHWKLSRPLWPRRDTLTNKWLWVKPAYLGTRIITGPGEPVIEYYWMSRDDFLIWNLKGKQ
jgi:hypothetical protein